MTRVVVVGKPWFDDEWWDIRHEQTARPFSAKNNPFLSKVVDELSKNGRLVVKVTVETVWKPERLLAAMEEKG